MVENQIQKNKRLLLLKGYEEEEELPEPEVFPEQVLQQFQARKNAKQDKTGEFDDLQLQWNPDHTLNTLTAYRNGRRLYTLHFAWNADGSLSQIMRG